MQVDDNVKIIDDGPAVTATRPHGSVAARSDGPGQGSEFCFTVPRYSRQIEQPRAS